MEPNQILSYFLTIDQLIKSTNLKWSHSLSLLLREIRPNTLLSLRLMWFLLLLDLFHANSIGRWDFDAIFIINSWKRAFIVVVSSSNRSIFLNFLLTSPYDADSSAIPLTDDQPLWILWDFVTWSIQSIDCFVVFWFEEKMLIFLCDFVCSRNKIDRK